MNFIILNSYVKVICLSYIFIDFKKTPFRYVFSIAINVFLWDCMGKDACITRMGAVRNYSANFIMKKTGDGVKDMDFPGVN